MTRPILRVDTNSLSDDELPAVEKLLDELGVQGEEMQPHLGIPEALDAFLAMSGDSLHVVFDAMLASAGGAAGAKLVQLLRRLSRGKTADVQVIAGSDEGGSFWVTKEAAGDPDAMTAMLHIDTGLLASGDVFVWDSEARKWRRRQ